MGLLTAIYIQYLLKYPNDTWFHKILATLSFFFALAIHIDQYFIGWYYLIESRTDLSLLSKTPKFQFVGFCGPIFMAAMAHIFFARRAFMLANNNKLVLVLLGIPILFTFSEGLVLVIHAALGNRAVTQANKSLATIHKTQLLLSMWSWSSAATDIVIASTLSYLLMSTREGFSKGTDNLLVRLATLAVSTASVTAVFGMLEAILLSTTIGKNNSNLAAHIILNFVYPISIIFTLNMRQGLQGNLSTTPGHSDNSNRGYMNSRKNNNSNAVSQGITIDISTSTRVEGKEYGMTTFDQEKQEYATMGSRDI